jgi:glutamine synthetase
MDLFTTHRTLSLVGDIVDPVLKKPYTRDPRFVAKKAVEYLRSTGIAHDVYVGPEQEFFLFDGVGYSLNPHHSFFRIESNESITTSADMHTAHYKIRHKEGYFPVKPWDQFQDIRSEICLECDKLGLRIERSHHEVAATGQGEINYRFDDLVRSAENVQTFKYVVRNVAARHGKLATFMPKPVSGENGTGMHTHVSLHLKDGKNLFIGDRYAGLSQMALHFAGGIIKHSKSLLAFTNPTVNSYKRLVPGFEAPVNMAYSARNRSASLRIPLTANPKAKRIEFRTPDGSCNPYLAFAAITMAGLDGIKNKIDPGAPLEKDIYALSADELANVPKAPTDLSEAIDSLERDHQFLTAGDVFTGDLIETWISRKREFEINPSRKLITPFEIHQYLGK